MLADKIKEVNESDLEGEELVLELRKVIRKSCSVTEKIH